MQRDEPIAVDDPAVLALVERLAAMVGCSAEEAIGLAVSRELALPDQGEGAVSDPGFPLNRRAVERS